MGAQSLVDNYPIISDQITKQELRVILREAERALSRAGAFVEFGCYAGTTSLFLERLFVASGDAREFHVYDSFQGLPEKTAQDQSPSGEQFRAGELSVSRKDFIVNFKKAGLRLPRVHKGWFDELADSDVPDGIAFAFLDGDYYESVRVPLELVESKLVPGAIIVIDDYANLALPGAARAAGEWARAQGYEIRSEQSLGIIHT